MRKCFLVFIAVSFLFVQSGFPQARLNFREKLNELEERISKLEEEVKNMTQETEEESATMVEDENDPIEPGDIKIVKGTLEVLDNCDSDAQWSVESGEGVTIEEDSSVVQEGSGSLKITIPPSTTAIVKLTGGPWDLSALKYLKLWHFYYGSGEGAGLGNAYLYFGEAVYNENVSSAFFINNVWSCKSWDISEIPAANRNAVTQFAFKVVNNDATFPYDCWIDYVIADPGPSQIKAFDGDRVIQLYPKVYTSHYHATGDDDLAITIPRKGPPSRIQIDGMVTRTVLWTTDMAAGHSKRMSNDTADNTDITDGIKSVGDCYFTVGTGAQVNTNGTIYHYTVWWDD